MVNNHPNYERSSDLSTDIKEGKFLSPFQRKLLQKSLKNKLRPEHRRRIEIMLFADRDYSQAKICAALNCSHETARYWMLMAQTGQAHRWKSVPIGRPKTINENYLERLQYLVDRSPKEFGYAFNHWTAQWLSKHLAKELGVSISDRHINRLLKQMGLSTGYKQSKTPVNKKTESVSDTNRSFTIDNLNEKNVTQSLYFSPFFSGT